MTTPAEVIDQYLNLLQKGAGNMATEGFDEYVRRIRVLQALPPVEAPVQSAQLPNWEQIEQLFRVALENQGPKQVTA